MPNERSGPKNAPEYPGDPVVPMPNGHTAGNHMLDDADGETKWERGKSGGLSTADLAQAGGRQASPSAPNSTESPIRRPDNPSTAWGAWDGTVGNSDAQTGTAAVRQRETTPVSSTTPLFEPAQSQELRARWDKIQLLFVDEPRQSVEQADALVADTMQRLAQVFARERETLENQWDRSGDISTEELRVAVQRYRSFFDRLLNI